MTGVHGANESIIVQETELITLYPRLYHMAEDGSWPSIQKHGLLSTSALLDLYQVNGTARIEIESNHRPQSVILSRDGEADIVVRDQIPMSDSALEKCLEDDLRPSDWYETLNSKTFFWLSRERLWRLLGARAYRDKPQTVLTLETSTLVAAYRDEILLSPINSGSTIMNPRPRGLSTFLPVADYPYAERRRTRSKQDALVELVIPNGVPDITSHVISVHRVLNSELEELWRRDGTDPSDGPAL